MLTFRDTSCLTSIICTGHTVQKTTTPFTVSPGGTSPTTTQIFGLSFPQIGMYLTILPKKHYFCNLHAVFDYGQNVPPTNKVFATVGDVWRPPTSQKFAQHSIWRNSLSRLHHSVYRLSAGGG